MGKVRNGFVPRMRREVYQQLAGLRTTECPFSNLPEKKRTIWALTAEQMKECQWLEPRLIAQIEFNEWTPDGHLRQQVLRGCARTNSHTVSCENNMGNRSPVFTRATITRADVPSILSTLRRDLGHIYFAVFPGSVFFCAFFSSRSGKQRRINLAFALYRRYQESASGF